MSNADLPNMTSSMHDLTFNNNGGQMVHNMTSNANGMAFSGVGGQRSSSEAQRRGSVLASRESLHQIMAKSALENSFRNKKHYLLKL